MWNCFVFNIGSLEIPLARYLFLFVNKTQDDDFFSIIVMQMQLQWIITKSLRFVSDHSSN